MNEQDLHVVVGDRNTGRTTTLVGWVLQGQPVRGYPFWSRVLLVADIRRADQVRRAYPELDYRQVFAFTEWATAHGTNPDVEVAIDDAEMALAALLHGHGRLAAVALAASPADVDLLQSDASA